MRAVAGLVVILVVSTAHAAPRTLVADVDYDFVDKNGMGWAMVAGKVAVTLTFDGDTGALKVTGKRSSNNARLTSGTDMASDRWEGDVAATYPLRDIVRTGRDVAFALDPGHDKLTVTCAPAKVDGVASSTLYECAFTGFQWQTVASLPELHHPIVFESNPRSKARILNTLRGSTSAGFGQRTVAKVKPAPKRKSNR